MMLNVYARIFLALKVFLYLYIIMNTTGYQCICDHAPFARKQSLQEHLKYKYCFPKQNDEVLEAFYEETKKRSFKRGNHKLSRIEKYNMDFNPGVNPLVYNSTTNYNAIYNQLSNKNINFIYDGGGYKWIANKFLETFKDIIFINSNGAGWVMLEENTLVKINQGFHEHIFLPFWEELEYITTDKHNLHMDKSFKKHYKNWKAYHTNMPAQFRAEVQKHLKPILHKYYLDKSDISKYTIKKCSELFGFKKFK